MRASSSACCQNRFDPAPSRPRSPTRASSERHESLRDSPKGLKSDSSLSPATGGRSDGQAVVDGPAGAGCWCHFGRHVPPGGRSAVRGERRECSEVGGTAARSGKAKFGGLEVSDAKRLRSLEEENARLKRLLADTMLDNAGLKDLLPKSGDARREAASGRASPGDAGNERAAGVCCHRGRSHEYAVSVVPGG